MSLVADQRVPSARPGLLHAEVADAVVLLDPARVRVHALNSSAWLVLDRCDGTATVGAIIDAIVRADDSAAAVPDAHAIATEIRSIIDRLHTEALITFAGDEQLTTSTPVGPPPGSFAMVPHRDEPLPPIPPGPPSFTSSIHRGLDLRFEISTDDAELQRYLTHVLSPLREAVDQPSTDDLPLHRYTINDDPDVVTPAGLSAAAGRARVVGVDGHVIDRTTADGTLAGLVLWHINQMVSTTSTNRLLLHAAAASRDGRAVVLPASMNSGKSTLVTALVGAGLDYITDETVAIDLRSGRIRPYPKPITLDPGSWELFPHLAPPVDGPAAPNGFFHHKWYVDPARVRPDTSPRIEREPEPEPALIVFPRYEAGATVEAEPLSPAAAAVELASNSFNLVTLGDQGLDAIVSLVTAVPCYRLVLSDLDDACAAISELLGADPAEHPGNPARPRPT